jgi:hypothetical protein
MSQAPISDCGEQLINEYDEKERTEETSLFHPVPDYILFRDMGSQTHRACVVIVEGRY